MKLSDYLRLELILFLKGSTKEECLGELVDAIIKAGRSPDRNGLAEAIFHREKLMSTGIGLGIGVPHVRLEGVSEPCVAVGIHREGLKDYESLDGQPVRIIVLIVAGKTQHSLYIRLLASVTSLLKREEIRERILNADRPEEVYEILTESPGA